LIICNERHIPTAALNPLNLYSRQLKQIKNQISETLPHKKKIWQQIVCAKIQNQAKCLKILGKDGSDKLLTLSKTVKSGDTSNVEGRAAAIYFKALFGNSFTRDEDIAINAALNYGYAIIRAIISRTVSLYGFEPSLGIHHCSELNNFNLSDDIIEPFRPFIDLTVSKSLFDLNEFNTADKAVLLKSINASILMDGKKQSIAYAIEKMVQSYSDCIRTGDTTITLPSLIDLEYKENE